MKLQNDLIAQQVEIFRNTSILKGQDDIALGQLKEIEEKKLKLSVKPNLWLNGAGYKGFDGELTIDLNNKGEDAKLIEFNLTSDDIILQLIITLRLRQRTKKIYFRATKENKHIKDCDYEIDVIYQDKLENRYMSKIKGTGANAKIIETREI